MDIARSSVGISVGTNLTSRIPGSMNSEIAIVRGQPSLPSQSRITYTILKSSF
jgi:hypothetical protein